MDIKRQLNRISVQVALVVVIIVAGLLVTLNFVVVHRGAKTFSDVYGILREQGNLPPSDVPFIVPDSGMRMRFFGAPLTDVRLTASQQFTSRFQSSLLIIGLLALVMAIGLGWLTSLMVSRPLRKLSDGIAKLRQSHYRLRLEESDSEEFNELIQEFNHLAEELQRTEELRKNLISDTSHELKTPITSLSAQLEGIEDGVMTLDANRVRLLREQVHRLNELTESLQEYASLRNQAVRPHVKNMRLNELLTSIVTQFHDRLKEKRIDTDIKVPEAYVISADQKLLERVFINLFENALRYSQAKNITISTDNTSIIFADDGIGIPPQYQTDIFERFFRIDKSRSRETGGLGLGLSIVHEIVEAHGWKIVARSPKEGTGIEFVISW